MLSSKEKSYIKNEIETRSLLSPLLMLLVQDYTKKLNKENLLFTTIKQHLNSILDFDFYLFFVERKWSEIKEEDFVLFERVLKSCGISSRTIKLKINHSREFLKYYEINKHKTKFFN